VASRSDSKRAKLGQWLTERRIERAGELEWREMLTALAPISESYLRKLLRGSGVSLAPMVEGVVQSSLVDLERTLLALANEYEAGARDVRRIVITAKDHARFALKKFKPDDPKIGERQEMFLWMMTWLENPALFPVWLAMRKRIINT
jgi:hypothetical protein